MNNQDKSLSKFLSLVLRHKPEIINLYLDEHGWAFVDELITNANVHNVPLTPERLNSVVATNDKKRFVFSEDHKKIRASQGHSVTVDLGLTEMVPPDQLFHGTIKTNIDSIKAHGLLKGKRQHVHLSADFQTAKSVGSRYGKPIVIGVNTKLMYQNGFKLFRSENGVWLTDHVPPKYLDFTPLDQ